MNESRNRILVTINLTARLAVYNKPTLPCLWDMGSQPVVYLTHYLSIFFKSEILSVYLLLLENTIHCGGDGQYRLHS
jgi:hypothetical protein